MAIKGIGASYWNDTQGQWDRLVVNGQAFPGVWQVRGRAMRKLDVKKAKDTDGARTRDQGYQAAELTFTGRFASRQEWEELQVRLPEIHPRGKGKRRAPPAAISHPVTQFLGIQRVIVREIVSPTVTNAGIMTFQFKAVEWFPAVRKVKPSREEGPTQNTFTDPELGVAQTPADLNQSLPPDVFVHQVGVSPASYPEGRFNPEPFSPGTEDAPFTSPEI